MHLVDHPRPRGSAPHLRQPASSCFRSLLTGWPQDPRGAPYDASLGGTIGALARRTRSAESGTLVRTRSQPNTISDISTVTQTVSMAALGAPPRNTAGQRRFSWSTALFGRAEGVGFEPTNRGWLPGQRFSRPSAVPLLTCGSVSSRLRVGTIGAPPGQPPPIGNRDSTPREEDNGAVGTPPCTPSPRARARARAGAARHRSHDAAPASLDLWGRQRPGRGVQLTVKADLVRIGPRKSIDNLEIAVAVAEYIDWAQPPPPKRRDQPSSHPPNSSTTVTTPPRPPSRRHFRASTQPGRDTV